MSWWREQIIHYPIHAVLSVIGFGMTVLGLVILLGVDWCIAALVALYGVIIFAGTIEAGDLLWKYIYPFDSLNQRRDIKRRDFLDGFLDFWSWVVLPLWLATKICG